MSEPGVLLRRFARQLLPPLAMIHIIDPALADLQHECLAARGLPHSKRLWVCLRAYWSFWRVVVWLASRGEIMSVTETSHEHLNVTRVLLIGTLTMAFVAAVVALAVPLIMNLSLAQLRIAFEGHVGRALLLLIPQAIPVALPPALLVGSVWGLRRQTVCRRESRLILLLGILGSLLSAVMLESVIPQTNQAFRVAIYQDGNPQRPPPQPGGNELAWRELGRRIEQEYRAGRLSAVRELRLSYQGRLAFATSPLIFAMVAASLLRRPRTRASLTVSLCALGAFVGYYTLIGFDQLVAEGTLSPALVAWTPNAIALAVCVLVSFRTSLSSVAPALNDF